MPKGRCVKCSQMKRDENDSFYNPKEQACEYHKGYTTQNALRMLECAGYQYEGDIKIIDAKIDWYKGSINSPKLKVLVDRIPRQKDLIYQQLTVEDTLYLYAESRGYISYMVRSKDLTQYCEGFAGNQFKVNVFNSDGFTISEIEFSGAWSSRSSHMNLYFNPKSEEVSITDSEKTFNYDRQSGVYDSYVGIFYAGNIRLDLVKQAIELINNKSDVKAKLVQTHDTELGYSIQRIDFEKPCNVCKGFGKYLEPFPYPNRPHKTEECRWCHGTGVKTE